VQDTNRAILGGENFQQTTIGLRRFVEVAHAQLNLAVVQSLHHLIVADSHPSQQRRLISLARVLRTAAIRSTIHLLCYFGF